MKRIRINTGKIGLVFRNENYKKVVAEGAYWLFPNEVVREYDKPTSLAERRSEPQRVWA